MFGMIALKLVTGFIGLLVVMRIVGKKTLSDLTPFDIIYSLLLGGILEESIYDNNIHVSHVLFALAIWGAIIYVMEILLRNNNRTMLQTKGYPSVLIFEGQLNLEELKNNHIEMEQLRTVLREQGCFSLKNAQYMVMEVNGEFSIIMEPDSPSIFTFLVVDEGKIKERSLVSMGKTEEWVRTELEKMNYLNIEELIYAEWSAEEGFFCKLYSDCIERQIHLDG